MTPEIDRIRKLLFTAIASGAESVLQECSFDIESIQMESEVFDSDAFDLLIRAMQSRDFLDMKGSWRLLTVLDLDREKLTTGQKAILADALGVAYPRFRDPQSWFFVSELVGKALCDQNGLACLNVIRQQEDEVARSVAAHGFEHFVRCDDVLIRNTALQTLFLLASDRSVRVRSEARLSLRKIRDLVDDAAAAAIDDVTSDE